MNIFIIIGAVVFALFVIMVGFYNSFVRLRNKVSEAFSTMDVFLKKRYDLIPELVAVVKGYAKHETDVLTEVTAMRARAKGKAGQLEGEVGIGRALEQLFVVAEAYPDLKANENFLNLQKDLKKIEDDIAFSRRYYNGSVREYNNQCQLFPMNIMAKILGFRPAPMFAAGEAEREAPRVF